MVGGGGEGVTVLPATAEPSYDGERSELDCIPKVRTGWLGCYNIQEAQILSPFYF